MPPSTTAAASGATGIRGAYETLGVQGFYEAHGHEYSNPHNEQIVRAISELMSSQEFSEGTGQQLRVLDLACGSGEVTLALEAWASEQQHGGQRHGQQQNGKQQPQQNGKGPRQQQQDGQGTQQQQQQQQHYGQQPQQHGQQKHCGQQPKQQPPLPQQQHGKQKYPQQQQQQQGRQQVQRRGQYPRAGSSHACTLPPLLHITACDPYTHEAYRRRTGGSVHRWSFQDIADGCLAGRSFDLCVCSFALHLCDPSCLFITLYQLACHCRWLAVLAPHKQPAVREEHGWAAAQALKVDRVHVRLYASLNWGQQQD